MSVELARWGLGLVLGAEGVAAWSRFRDRQQQYEAAQARAIQLGRPLVVIGDPDAGMHTRLLRAYGCGSSCIDLLGCPGCPVSIPADITAGPVTRVPTNSAIVFCACVLEYVSNPAAAWREILRMAGDPANIFLVSVQSYTITSALYPGARSMITRAPGAAQIVATPVTTLRKAVYGTSLTALTAAALKPWGITKLL